MICRGLTALQCCTHTMVPALSTCQNLMILTASSSRKAKCRTYLLQNINNEEFMEYHPVIAVWTKDDNAFSILCRGKVKTDLISTGKLCALSVKGKTQLSPASLFFVCHQGMHQNSTHTQQLRRQKFFCCRTACGTACHLTWGWH